MVHQPSKIKNKSPGTFGKVNAMSMHPLKSLNVMGDGGMVVTNSKKMCNKFNKCIIDHKDSRILKIGKNGKLAKQNSE